MIILQNLGNFKGYFLDRITCQWLLADIRTGFYFKPLYHSEISRSLSNRNLCFFSFPTLIFCEGSCCSLRYKDFFSSNNFLWKFLFLLVSKIYEEKCPVSPTNSFINTRKFTALILELILLCLGSKTLKITIHLISLGNRREGFVWRGNKGQDVERLSLHWLNFDLMSLNKEYKNVSKIQI